MPTLHYYTVEAIKAISKKSGQNQVEFWGPFGVTQSGGNTYESGREMPEPVQILLNIVLSTPAASAKVVRSLREWD